MIDIVRSDECGNSPKNHFAEEIAIDLFTGKKEVLAMVSMLEDPDIGDVRGIEIVHAITHGKTGAVELKVRNADGTTDMVCLMIEFRSAKADAVQNLRMYRMRS